MLVTMLSDKQAARKLIDLVRGCDRFYVAVAWATENPVLAAMREARAKIGQMVIGTHMYQTDPEVLESFKTLPTVRCMAPSGRLFHPKIYIFQMKKGLAAVVGSHNLTAGAFGGNIEVSVLFECPDDEPLPRELLQFVNAKWLMAEGIADLLYSYTAQYDAKKSKREALEQFHRFERPATGNTIPPFDLSWPEFVKRVKNDTHHSLDGRLETLEGAAQLFANNESFASMTRDERKAIAGTYARGEERLNDLEWPWFGAMSGAGDFKSLINNSPNLLSKALDEIPARGDVSEAQYDAFIGLFQKAFVGKSHKGKIPSASRLLAMKRPDVFVCVNDANRRGICDAFGSAFSTLKSENYWARIIVPIQNSPWWLASRPKEELPARIWDNRAALLDSIYYVPKTRG